MVSENEIREILFRFMFNEKYSEVFSEDSIQEIKIKDSNVHIIIKPLCACPLPFVIATRAKKEIKKLKGVKEVEIEVVI